MTNGKLQGIVIDVEACSFEKNRILISVEFHINDRSKFKRVVTELMNARDSASQIKIEVCEKKLSIRTRSG